MLANLMRRQKFMSFLRPECYVICMANHCLKEADAEEAEHVMSFLIIFLKRLTRILSRLKSFGQKSTSLMI